ncbi:ATP-dependent nuclease [Tenacibaculum piscium]|uniref:ATP-dependent nuclease n=1 Tax=Tenacibaculum piscium TaxID=1458515 RepID=UPI001F227A3D|nr:TOPRIM nucleotidyl transferase/hydrolase domain-containing protein [Tenacibaculum piscium]
MINKNVDITIPLLWGEEHFVKNEWGTINYLVGANGTGKSLLAEQIKNRFSGGGFKPRYLNAERLVGLEKEQEGRYGGGNLKQGFNITYLEDYKSRAETSGLSSSAIIILKQRLDIRIKIEALLSDIFGKTIRLAEEGGYLKPKMQNIEAGEEYNLSESECHGLKELITLLTFLYDPAKNCIIFDEPELHLHPQFQSFFLQEIRKIAGNPIEDPSKKMFFIITHSPYFIDLKSLDELSNILVCHYNKIPTYVNELEAQDKYILNKFLPRFNTHHKQFFFSPNPVFVEGYTDQQIISILFEKLGINIGASGSCIIDVGGKDELGVFFRLCKALQINCRIIADLDAVFRGKLREVVCEDERSKTYVQEQGIGANLSGEIGDLETHLTSIANYISAQELHIPHLIELKEKIDSFPIEKEHSKRVTILLAISRHEADIRATLNAENIANLNLIIGRLSQLFNAFKACDTFIFPKGEIEHYYTQSEVNYLSITNKDTYFHTERDFLLQLETKEDILNNYPELTEIIKEAVPSIEIEILKHLKFEIFEWIHKVQTGIAKGEIDNENDLKRNVKINYSLYNQILELQELNIEENRTFECRIIIKETISAEQPVVNFNQLTNAHNFKI